MEDFLRSGSAARPARSGHAAVVRGAVRSAHLRHLRHLRRRGGTAGTSVRTHRRCADGEGARSCSPRRPASRATTCWRPRSRAAASRRGRLTADPSVRPRSPAGESICLEGLSRARVHLSGARVAVRHGLLRRVQLGHPRVRSSRASMTAATGPRDRSWPPVAPEPRRRRLDDLEDLGGAVIAEAAVYAIWWGDRGALPGRRDVRNRHLPDGPPGLEVRGDRRPVRAPAGTDAPSSATCWSPHPRPRTRPPPTRSSPRCAGCWPTRGRRRAPPRSTWSSPTGSPSRPASAPGTTAGSVPTGAASTWPTCRTWPARPSAIPAISSAATASAHPPARWPTSPRTR